MPALLADTSIPAIDRIRQALQPGQLPPDVLESFIGWCLQQACEAMEPDAPAEQPDPWEFGHTRRSLLQLVWDRAGSDPVAGWTAAWYAVWNAEQLAADQDAAGAAWLAAWCTAWAAAKQAVRGVGPFQRPAAWAEAWTGAWNAAWNAQVLFLLSVLPA